MKNNSTLIKNLLSDFRINSYYQNISLMLIGSLILAISKPGLLLYPYRAWMKLGHILGWLNSRVILGLVFLIVLQPIALIMRILGHDPLKTKKLPQKSYREIKTNHKVNLKKIF